MEIMEEINKGRILIMGILNVTPDSFSDGGKFFSKQDAVRRGLQMEDEGADLIDIGGESTRPGAEKVEPKEELHRTIPIIEEIRKESGVPISIDTYKSRVARKALEAGADLVNDVSALRFDPKMGETVARAGVPLVLMHIQGTPRTMQNNPTYEDVVGDIIQFLKERKREAIKAGIPKDEIILDPGIGFGKTVEDNFEIMRRLEEFAELNSPLLLGTSRKSFIGKTLDLPVEERLEGTIATNVIGAIRGASVLRVHDVREVKKALKVAEKCF